MRFADNCDLLQFYSIEKVTPLLELPFRWTKTFKTGHFQQLFAKFFILYNYLYPNCSKDIIFNNQQSLYQNTLWMGTS